MRSYWPLRFCVYIVNATVVPWLEPFFFSCVLSLLRSIDIIIRTHLGSSSCAGAALTFLACLVFVEPIIPAMVKALQNLPEAMKAKKKTIHMTMDDITKAIADQTEMKPERVQAVFDALVEIAKAKVQKTADKEIPTFVSLKLVEAKAGKRMMFFKWWSTRKAKRATTKSMTACDLANMDMVEANKAWTTAELSNMMTEGAARAADAAALLMAAAHMAVATRTEDSPEALARLAEAARTEDMARGLKL